MKFLFIANRFCLDFVNTIIAIDGQETDLLIDSASVSEWLDSLGLSLDQTLLNNDLKQLRELRLLIRHWVLRPPQSERETAKRVNALNQYLNQHQPAKRLYVDSDGFHLNTVEEKLNAQQLMRKIADDFANLLVNETLSQVKQCSGERCILVFLDTSKSKRRRWCSMESCGNRAKASAFYHSRKASH